MIEPTRNSSPQQPRVPNFKRFLITGAVIGFVIGAAISLLGEPIQNYDRSTGALYLGALGALVGTGIGGVVGILLDRSGRGRS